MWRWRVVLCKGSVELWRERVKSESGIVNSECEDGEWYCVKEEWYCEERLRRGSAKREVGIAKEEVSKVSNAGL